MRLRRVETVPALNPAQTPSLPFVGWVIICAVLATLSGCSAPSSLRKTAEAALAAGAQIITGQELIAYSAQTAARPIR